jgi:hypothetical protein
LQNNQIQGELTQLNNKLSSNLISVQAYFRNLFADPGFTIQGGTNVQQFQNLIDAILKLNNGRAMGLYQNFGGKNRGGAEWGIRRDQCSYSQDCNHHCVSLPTAVLNEMATV